MRSGRTMTVDGGQSRALVAQHVRDPLSFEIPISPSFRRARSRSPSKLAALSLS